jgi:hypothetical protein
MDISGLKAENKFMAGKIEAMPDHTGEKQVATRFKPGQSGNPAGRPKGARNKLGEAFVQALADDFAEHGVAVVERVRIQEPATYLKIIGNTLPREMLIQALSIRAGGTIADLERIQGRLEAYRYAREMIGVDQGLTAEAEACGAQKENDDDRRRSRPV